MRNCKFASSVLKASPFSLKKGDKVVAHITAVNDVGESDESKETDDTCIPELEQATIADVPQAPIQLKTDLKVVTKDAITFTWEKNLDNGGLEVTHFNIYDAESDLKITRITSDSPTLLFDNDIVLKKDYSFYVKSENEIGESLGSSKITIKAADVPAKPEPVFIMNYSGATQITVGWKAPDDQGSPILKYEIYTNKENEAEMKSTAKVDADTKKYILPDLTAGKQYKF